MALNFTWQDLCDGWGDGNDMKLQTPRALCCYFTPFQNSLAEAARGSRHIFAVVGSYLLKCPNPRRNLILPCESQVFKQMREVPPSFRSFTSAVTVSPNKLVTVTSDWLKMSVPRALKHLLFAQEQPQPFLVSKFRQSGLKSLKNIYVFAPSACCVFSFTKGEKKNPLQTPK